MLRTTQAIYEAIHSSFSTSSNPFFLRVLDTFEKAGQTSLLSVLSKALTEVFVTFAASSSLVASIFSLRRRLHRTWLLRRTRSLALDRILQRVSSLRDASQIHFSHKQRQTQSQVDRSARLLRGSSQLHSARSLAFPSLPDSQKPPSLQNRRARRAGQQAIRSLRESEKAGGSWLG